MKKYLVILSLISISFQAFAGDIQQNLMEEHLMSKRTLAVDYHVKSKEPTNSAQEIINNLMNECSGVKT